MDRAELEGLAEETLSLAGIDAPVDALELAAACGLRVLQSALSAARYDATRRAIYVDSRARPARLQGLVAHELGHALLDPVHVKHRERAASYIAGCLRLPRRAFVRDLSAIGWSVLELRERHRHASEIAIAVRITQLRAAAIGLFDARRRARPWIVSAGPACDPRHLERMALEAWDAGREVVYSDGATAIPLPDYAPGLDRSLAITPCGDE